jgi:NADH ubiquinone oxidoreductase subunit NDUFA12
MTYMTNEPPTLDPTIKVGSTNPKWEKQWHGTPTFTDAAYRPYSTVKLKYESANDTIKPKARE